MTIKNILAPDGKLPVPPLRSALAVSTNLLGQFERLGWGNLVSGVHEAIESLLDIDVLDIVTYAWNKHRLLTAELAHGSHQPDDLVEVPLADHVVESVLHPALEIYLDNQLVTSLEFEIQAVLSVDGAVAVIRNGRIEQLRTGTCKGTVKLRFQNALLAQASTDSIQLPGSIVFTDQAVVAFQPAVPVPAPARSRLAH